MDPQVDARSCWPPSFPVNVRAVRALLGLGSCLMLAWAIVGCGPSYPPRYVVEREIGHLSYRRYQRVLDVEFPVNGNDAVGHTATYVRRTDRGEPPYVNVFVTVYDHPGSLTAEVRHQVQSLESYDVEVADVGGGRAWRLDGGTDDRWVLWVSSRFVVKIGGDAPPDLLNEVVSAYMGIYPSDLDDHGRAREGTASAGDAVGEVGVEQEEMEMPRSLGGEGDTASTPAQQSTTPPESGGT
jgi:hypothetical protein